jgi:hypothetical protein
MYLINLEINANHCIHATQTNLHCKLRYVIIRQTKPDISRTSAPAITTAEGKENI